MPVVMSGQNNKNMSVSSQLIHGIIAEGFLEIRNLSGRFIAKIKKMPEFSSILPYSLGFTPLQSLF